MNEPDTAAIQRLRLLRTSYAMGAGVALSCVMLMLFLNDHTRLSWTSLSLGMLIFWPLNFCFVLMIITNMNLRLQDQTMTFAMMIWGTTSSFAWAYFTVDNRHLVIMVYLLAMMLGAFRLRLKQYLQITAYALTLYALVIAALAYKPSAEPFSASRNDELAGFRHCHVGLFVTRRRSQPCHRLAPAT